MRHMRLFGNKVGDMGIGAMIVFIAMVLVAGIAASVLVQTANKLEIRAMQTGQQTTKEVSSGLNVIDIEGLANTVTHKIVNMTLTIKTRAGSGDIDLNQTIVELTDGTTKVLLSYNMHDKFDYNTSVNNATASVFGTGNWTLANNQFGILVLNDADGSMNSIAAPVINTGDIVMLKVSTAACFNPTTLTPGLNPRADIVGQVIPEIGSPGIFAFRVPSSLSAAVYDLY